MSLKRLLLILAAVVACAVTAVIVWTVVMIERHGIYAFQSQYSGHRLIRYDGYYFHESKGTVSALEVILGLQDQCPNLYLRFSSQPNKTYFLPSITKAEGASLAVSQETSEGLDGAIIQRYHLGGRNLLKFENNRLAIFRLSGKGVSVSPSKDGPFIELPTKLRNVIKAFGEPLEYQKQKQRFL